MSKNISTFAAQKVCSVAHQQEDILKKAFIDDTYIIIMTAKRRQEVLRKQQDLLQIMLKKAGVTKRDIYSVAERRWVNSNIDLLSAEEQKEYADVLAL